MKWALVVAAVSLVTPVAAMAGDVWTCTYPGYGNGNRPVLARYRILGDDLVEDQFQEHYRILLNNQYAVIATWSFAAIEPGHTEPSISGRTLVIDKATGEFLWSNTAIGYPDSVNAPTHGTCIKG